MLERLLAVPVVRTRTRGRTWWRVLNRPLAATWCTVGLLASCGLFYAMTRILGGVSAADGAQTWVPAFAMAHGDFACMYPPVPSHPAFTAPVYPIVVSVLALVFRAGHEVAFPAGGALGAHCASANTAIGGWITYSGAFKSALWFAYSSWLVFLVGLIAFMRTTSRGRTWWEPVTALALAATPPVLMSVTSYYHPEDLICLGLILFSMAAVRRERFVLAGVVLATALLTQQFAILAALPIVLTLSGRAPKRLVTALGGTLVVVVGTLAALSQGRVLASLSTAGDTDYSRSVWISGLHLHAVWLMTLVSRGPPILIIAVLALAARRLPPSDATVPSLVAAGFALRLAFEVNIFPYYYMAVAIVLVVADVVRGRVRPLVLLWLVVEWLLYNPFGWPRRLTVERPVVDRPGLVLGHCARARGRPARSRRVAGHTRDRAPREIPRRSSRPPRPRARSRCRVRHKHRAVHAELAPDPVRVDAQVVGLARVAATPHLAQDHLLGAHLPDASERGTRGGRTLWR